MITDRLWSTPKPMKKLKPNFSIPVVDLQRKVEDDLRDQIELLNLKLEDTNDALTLWKREHASLTLRNEELKYKVEQEQEYRNKNIDNSAKLRQLEFDIIAAKNKTATEIANRDHFRSLVAEQDALIKELKTKMAKMESEQRAVLEARKNEVDHLAKQCVRLNEENGQLKTDNCKFQEQTNRLIEENRKLTDERDHHLQENRNLECWGCKSGEQGSYCGGCLGCLARQAEHAMSEMDKSLVKKTEELAHEQKISMLRWQMIEILAATIKTIKGWKWYIRGKDFYIQTQQRSVDDLHRQIRKERKEFYKLSDKDIDGVLSEPKAQAGDK